MYPDICMFIGGEWRREGREMRDVINPATGRAVGQYPVATAQDLDEALAAAERGFEIWRNTPAADRAEMIRKAGAILASRADEIAPIITLEQGKPVTGARFEPIFAEAELNWFAEEAVRTYGRVIPAREAGQRNFVVKEPIGPALIIAPWNYPLLSPNVKIGAALAAGCSVIIKPSEETPGGCMELVRAFAEAGLPEGVLNMVTGAPDMIARHCLGSPVIRKLSFTGSTQVGKHLVGFTTTHLQVPTLELGGHAPVIVHDDVDVAAVAGALVAKKLQNGGQVCLSPTRFYIHEGIYAPFVEAMAKGMSAVKIGDGMKEGTTLGPMINAKRVETLEAMTRDAVEKGARVVTGGERVGNTGFFFAPHSTCRCAGRGLDDAGRALWSDRALSVLFRSRRGDRQGQQPAVRAQCLCLRHLQGGGAKAGLRTAIWDRVHQPHQCGLSRNAHGRGEVERLRQGIGGRGAGCLLDHQVHQRERSDGNGNGGGRAGLRHKARRSLGAAVREI